MEHCIVSFASPPQGLEQGPEQGSEQGLERDSRHGLEQARASVLAKRRLPGLEACVSGAAVVMPPTATQAQHAEGRSGGDIGAAEPELRWSPPHEQALAAALGLVVPDGCVPLAGLAAARAGLPADGRVWGRISPAHWQLGTEQITMHDPDELALDEASSRALFEAARPLFEEEGFEWRWLAPTLWLVSHPSLQGLPCASLDRVSGRNVDLWLAADPRARLVRRLQNEVQMLWHAHPLNTEREAQGLPVVNSFWLDGCGPVPAAEVLARADAVRLEQRLRRPALQGDAQAWWEALSAWDAEVLQPAVAAAAQGDGVVITLCGERTSVTLRPQAPRGLWQRLMQGWRQRQASGRVQKLMESL
jgi:hypothetical protein